MGLVTKDARSRAKTDELLVELQCQLLDCQDVAREIARRLQPRPPVSIVKIVKHQKAA